MNQYAKRCPPSVGDIPATLQVGADLLTPRVTPAEQIRRTLVRRSFAGPTTGEVPNIFVVPPPPSKSPKPSSSSKEGRPPDLDFIKRRASLGDDNIPLTIRKLSSGSLPPPSTDSSGSPRVSALRDRNSSPTFRVGPNQHLRTSLGDPESSPPLRLIERHSTSSLPRLSPKREESHLARHSSPLPSKTSSRPSSRSNSPQLGDAIQPQPLIRRRVLPPIPANLTLSPGASAKSSGATGDITSSTSSATTPELATMRNKHTRTPSDPPHGDFPKKPYYGVGRSPSDPAHGDQSNRFRYPVVRNPPDGSSHSPRTSDGIKYDLPRDSSYVPQREFRRLSQQDMPPRNQREELLKGQPEFHRSLSNLHASHRKADPMHMSQDSLDDINPTHRGGFDSKERAEYRGPPYGASGSPDRRHPEGVQRSTPRGAPPENSPTMRTPTHEASIFQNSPTVTSIRQASTLPRRPHSTHGDLLTGGNYGSLQRPTRDSTYTSTQAPAAESTIMPQPTRAAPTTVNQILYGSANSAGRGAGVVYAGQELSPERTQQTWDESNKDYEIRSSPPRITSGYATTGRTRRPSRAAIETLRRSKSFHEADGAESPQAGRSAVDELGTSASRGSVAKYVQDFERGIKSTVNNMLSTKSGSSVNISGPDEFSSYDYPKKDLKYSHSFKYPQSGPNVPQKSSPGITHSQSFKLASGTRDSSHYSGDRYRPYVQPRRSPSLLDHSPINSSIANQRDHFFNQNYHYNKTRDHNDNFRTPLDSARPSRDQVRPSRDNLTLDLRNRSPRRNITNEIINSESLQLLKKYSQESPTWCGVDSLAKRRWDRHAVTPEEPPARPASWRWSGDPNLSEPRRNPSDDVQGGSSAVPPSNRHSFYDVPSYRSPPQVASLRIPNSEAAKRRRPLSDATLGNTSDMSHERLAPEGDDYKLVFISSDSSKGSEHNTSLESETAAPKLTKANSFHGKYHKSNRRVDAAVNTDDLHGQEDYHSDHETYPPSSERISRRTARDDARSRPRSKSQHNLRYNPDEPPPRPPKPSHLCPPVGSNYFPPIGAIHPSQLHAMLQQTEAVQAEAQALQAALMGAFTPTEKPKYFAAPEALRPTKSNASTHSADADCHISRRDHSVPVVQTNELLQNGVAKKNVSTAQITAERRKSKDITVNIQSSSTLLSDASQKTMKEPLFSDNNSVLKLVAEKINSFPPSIRSAPKTGFENDRRQSNAPGQILVRGVTDSSKETHSNSQISSSKTEPRKSELGRSASDVSVSSRPLLRTDKDLTKNASSRLGGEKFTPTIPFKPAVPEKSSSLFKFKTSSELESSSSDWNAGQRRKVRESGDNRKQIVDSSKQNGNSKKPTIFFSDRKSSAPEPRNEKQDSSLSAKRSKSFSSDHLFKKTVAHEKICPAPATSKTFGSLNFLSSLKDNNGTCKSALLQGSGKENFVADSKLSLAEVQHGKTARSEDKPLSSSSASANVESDTISHAGSAHHSKVAPARVSPNLSLYPREGRLHSDQVVPSAGLGLVSRSRVSGNQEDEDKKNTAATRARSSVSGEMDIVKLSEEARQSSNYRNVIETIKRRKSGKERAQEAQHCGTKVPTNDESSASHRDPSPIKTNSQKATSSPLKSYLFQDQKTSSNASDIRGKSKANAIVSDTTKLDQQNSDCASASTYDTSATAAVSSCSSSCKSADTSTTSTSTFASHLPSDRSHSIPSPPCAHLRREPSSVARDARVSEDVRRSSSPHASANHSRDFSAISGQKSGNQSVDAECSKGDTVSSGGNIVKSVGIISESAKENGVQRWNGLGQRCLQPAALGSSSDSYGTVTRPSDTSCDAPSAVTRLSEPVIRPPPRTKLKANSKAQSQLCDVKTTSSVSFEQPGVPPNSSVFTSPASTTPASKVHPNVPSKVTGTSASVSSVSSAALPTVLVETSESSAVSSVHIRDSSRPDSCSFLTKTSSTDSVKPDVSSTAISPSSARKANFSNKIPAFPPVRTSSSSVSTPTLIGKSSKLSPLASKTSISSKFRSAKLEKMSTETESTTSEVFPGDLDSCQEMSRTPDGDSGPTCDTDNSITDTDNSMTDPADDKTPEENKDCRTENGSVGENRSSVDSPPLESDGDVDDRNRQNSDLIENVDETSSEMKSLERNDDNDEAFDDCGSASSASDTDDDMHVSCQYDVNRSLSTSDMENAPENDDFESQQPINVRELNSENKLKTESSYSIEKDDVSVLDSVDKVQILDNVNVDNVLDDTMETTASQSAEFSASNDDETRALDDVSPDFNTRDNLRCNFNNKTERKDCDIEELHSGREEHRAVEGLTTSEIKLALALNDESNKLEDPCTGATRLDNSECSAVGEEENTDNTSSDHNIRPSPVDEADCGSSNSSPSVTSGEHVLGGSGGEISQSSPNAPAKLNNESGATEEPLDTPAENSSEVVSPGSESVQSDNLKLRDVDGDNDLSTGSSQPMEQHNQPQQQLGTEESQNGSSEARNRMSVACDTVVSECVPEPSSASGRDISAFSADAVQSSDESGPPSFVVADQVTSSSCGASELNQKSQESDLDHSVASKTERSNSADRDTSSVRHSPAFSDQSNSSSLKFKQSCENKEVIQPPKRTKKRSSSSDGLSSSSDIDRSDASDSADTIIERSRSDNSLKRLFVEQRRQRLALHDKRRPSDNYDSVLTGDSESQHSDNSEEGNLVSIVSVGGEDKPAPLTHGRIYIRSDSTDSDVQIKPTCIVVTGGSSGAESSEDCETDSSGREKSPSKDSSRKIKGNDVTILEVGSKDISEHVMSVQVTSPASSRSGSPTRQSNVSELQDIISTTKENQQQFRRSRSDSPEPSSGLANYFTLTLGFDSPHTPRRLNKTPEVRRRTKTPDRTLEEGINKASPSLSPTLTPSPNVTPNITPTPERDTSLDDRTIVEDIAQEQKDDLYDNKEQYGALSSLDDSQNFSSGAEDFEERDSFDHEYGDEMNEEEYFDDEYDDDDYGFDVPQADIKNCRPHLDLTLHTIIEESCEESDYDRRQKDDEASNPDPSELEKYFFFGLGNGPAEPKRIGNEESEYSDSYSETSSSIFNESLESNDVQENDEIDPAELASSRLEKYFLTGLGANFERQPSIRSVGEDSELHTDESGSVGSDSEGSPSPEQPRKKLLRPRGFRLGMASRSHGYSSDRGEYPSDGSHHSGEDGDGERNLVSGEDEGSTESEEIAFDKVDGQFDTIKRRKKKKSSSDLSDRRSDSEKSEIKSLDNEAKEDAKFAEKMRASSEAGVFHKRSHHDSGEKEGSKEKDLSHASVGDLSDRKYQSRDSGFIGSSDDLLKDKPEDGSKLKESREKMSSDSSADDKNFGVGKKEQKNGQNEADGSSRAEKIDDSNGKSETEERSRDGGKVSRSSTGSSADLPPFSKDRIKVSRKDSFNWSSDEETNIMMNRMRIFFRNMLMKARENAKEKSSTVKSPQLLLFEAKLTSLMKKVPDINDEQVKEIVEYLSSEDTWSDSYDSSDYTASDLEGTYALLDQQAHPLPSELSKQISASCQQIIQKFDQSREPSDTDSAHSLFGGRAYSESSEDVSSNNKETLFMYQRLLSTIGHMKSDSDRISIGSGSQNASPPLLAKVFHHIGNSLVELMHEVSGGSETGDDIDSLSGRNHSKSSKPPLFAYPDTSFESDGSPTDTEQSPESGTPKLSRKKALSIISERSSAEDFTSLESQRTVFASHDSPRHYTRPDSYLTPQTSVSQRSLEERGVTSIQYYVTEGSGNEPEVWQSVTIDEDKFDAREHVGVPKARKSSKRPDTRKAKSHMSLEKIQCDDIKTSTGERSESLGDLCDRFRHSDFSTTSSYEQLDSDSTLKASDSLDRHIGSSSSNIRLNASSRGSLTTSSRGSLAASSRGSLQGSSGPEDEDEKKSKKLGSFFRYPRRSSVPDPKNDRMSPEVRSTTLPRSTPAQLLPTATLPRTLPSSSGMYRASPSYSYPSSSQQTPESRGGISTSSAQSPAGPSSSGPGVPRSARYHAPGYRPPPSSKRNMSSTSARKGFRSWSSTEDGLGSGSHEDALPHIRSGYPPTHHHPHPLTTPTHHHHPPHHHPPPTSHRPPTATSSAPNTPLHQPSTPSTVPATPKNGSPSPIIGASSSGGLASRQSSINRSGVSSVGGSGGGGGGGGGGSLSSSLTSSMMSCGGDVSSSAADEDVEKLLMFQDRKRQHSLTTLGKRTADKRVT